MSVVRSGLYLVVSTGIKVLLGIIGIKIISYYIGTAGFGMLGQFMSLMSVIAITAGGGISNGIISKVSQYKNDSEKINHILSAGFWIGIFFSLILGLLLLLFSNFISMKLFEVLEYSFVIRILAFSQLFNSFAVVFGGYLNGLQRSKFFSVLTIISAIIGTLGLVILVHFFKVPGAMLGLIWLAISPGVLFFVFYFFKIKNDVQLFRLSKTEKDNVKSLLKYSLMLVLSAFLLPMVQILVRKLILENSNWDHVGYWQASSKISESGLVFLNVIMVNYYLPELGKCDSMSLLKVVIKKTYLILIPLVIVYVGIVFFTKSFLIPLLFNSSFQPAESLVTWQALGDSFKVLCLVFGFLIVLKEKLKIYLFFELLLFGLIALFSFIFIPKYGVIGANYAYVLSYFICFIIGLFFMRYYLKNDHKL